MRRTSETIYSETLRETSSRAGDMAEEFYDDLQEHKNQLRFIDSDRRYTLAKQVRGLYEWISFRRLPTGAFFPLREAARKSGHPIDSSEYLDRMERVVFRQDVPTRSSARWGSPNYDGLLRDALESIVHQLERDLERNERENNYITDETEENLKTTVSELERCGISTGSANSKIEKLAWFVGGDSAKIRQLQNKLNALHLSNQLLEDGVYGRKTDSARSNFMEELVHGTVPSLTWVDPLQSNWTGIVAATKTTKGGRQFSKLISAHSSLPLFSADGKSTYTSATSICGSWAGGALGAKGGALAGLRLELLFSPKSVRRLAVLLGD
ncbi:hypothetical protein [Oscillibacter sp.]|uniref:hypothetical protein n=1 Tax=Oscillibacter sp. TaxID=1945593 RepID=UPI0028AA354C|nr:hypothetical protein [Oscillibacter sp.]